MTEAAGSGRTDTFTVVLDTQPTANVTDGGEQPRHRRGLGQSDHA